MTSFSAVSALAPHYATTLSNYALYFPLPYAEVQYPFDGTRDDISLSQGQIVIQAKVS